MDTDLRTSFQTLSVLLEKRGYVGAVVRTIPLESRSEEFVQPVGEIIRRGLFSGYE